jgi:DNA adenine methylase
MEYQDLERSDLAFEFSTDGAPPVVIGKYYPTKFSNTNGQLLKWIGNKQRFAQAIISYFPSSYRTYYEPFLGSGAVLAALSPIQAEASDIFGPLIDIWQTLRFDPEQLKHWYSKRHGSSETIGKLSAYKEAQQAYLKMPNGADLLFLSRACYGGVVRFRKSDGYMSTPCGPHNLMSPAKFASRVDEWAMRVKGTTFHQRSFEQALAKAGEGDIVYCDPPYSHCQSILYGAQAFDLRKLMASITEAKKRGAFVALSIDGSKRSGNFLCDIEIPAGLFAREEMLMVGRSMLRRFQMGGETLEEEVVRDRLLLTH